MPRDHPRSARIAAGCSEWLPRWIEYSDFDIVDAGWRIGVKIEVSNDLVKLARLPRRYRITAKYTGIGVRIDGAAKDLPIAICETHTGCQICTGSQDFPVQHNLHPIACGVQSAIVGTALL